MNLSVVFKYSISSKSHSLTSNFSSFKPSHHHHCIFNQIRCASNLENNYSYWKDSFVEIMPINTLYNKKFNSQRTNGFQSTIKNQETFKDKHLGLKSRAASSKSRKVISQKNILFIWPYLMQRINGYKTSYNFKKGIVGKNTNMLIWQFYC